MIKSDLSKRNIEELLKESKENLAEVGIESRARLTDLEITDRRSYYLSPCGNVETNGKLTHTVHELLHKEYADMVLSDYELQTINNIRDWLKNRIRVGIELGHKDAIETIEKSMEISEMSAKDIFNRFFKGKNPRISQSTVSRFTSDRNMTPENIYGDDMYILFCEKEGCNRHVLKDIVTKKYFDVYDRNFSVVDNKMMKIPSLFMVDESHLSVLGGFSDEEKYMLETVNDNYYTEGKKIKRPLDYRNREVIDKLSWNNRSLRCKTVSGSITEAPAHLVQLWMEGEDIDSPGFEDKLSNRIYSSLGWGRDRGQDTTMAKGIMNLYNSQRSSGKSKVEAIAYAVKPEIFLAAISKYNV